LREFSFLADENIHTAVVAELRAAGSDVLDVRESGLRGSGDVDLLRLALADNRVVITHDKDFGALAIARSERLVGIVFLRPGHIDPRFTIQTLHSLFEINPELRPPFVLVAKRIGGAVTIRVRNL
jgi:predicted nuclease of predicted toxin-antitoxin system